LVVEVHLGHFSYHLCYNDWAIALWLATVGDDLSAHERVSDRSCFYLHVLYGATISIWKLLFCHGYSHFIECAFHVFWHTLWFRISSEAPRAFFFPSLLRIVIVVHMGFVLLATREMICRWTSVNYWFRQATFLRMN